MVLYKCQHTLVHESEVHFYTRDQYILIFNYGPLKYYSHILLRYDIVNGANFTWYCLDLNIERWEVQYISQRIPE